MSPTVFRERGYQFIIFTKDHEPPHVHVRSSGTEARVRIDVIELMSNDGCKPRVLRLIMELVTQHRAELLKAWHELHGEGQS